MLEFAARSARVLLAAFVLISSIAAPAGADEASSPLARSGIVIPMIYRPPGVSYPIVNLRINGQAPLPFLIDTGTNNFVIRPWAVAALALTPKTVTSKADGSIQQIIPALKARLEDAAQKRHLDVSVADARVLDAPILNSAVPGTRLAGIVSFGFLGWSVFRLDFAAKTLTIFPPSEQVLTIPGAARVPFELTSDALPAITFQTTAGETSRMIVDTGSLGSQIPVILAESLTGAHQTDYAFMQRASSLYITPQVQFDDLALGDLHVPNVAAVVLPGGIPSSLGLNVLSRYRVTVDVPHRQLYFEPSSGALIAWASSGVELTGDKSSWRVGRVDINAPAAKAGLTVGDTLLAVDGHDVEGASKHDVQALLYGRSGTTAQVTIQRASGAVQNITFIRAPFTPSLISPLAELMLVVIQGGPINVLDAPASSPAYRGGLRTSDRITTIGGHPVAAMDFGQIADALDAPNLILTVKRQGTTELITVTVEEMAVTS